MKFYEFILLIIVIPLLVIVAILVTPIILVFALIALVCFVIAIPSLIVFGLIYLVYKHFVTNRKSKIPLILFIIILIIFSPLLLIFVILFLPLGIVIMVVLYIIYGDGDTAGTRYKSGGFVSGYSNTLESIGSSVGSLV